MTPCRGGGGRGGGRFFVLGQSDLLFEKALAGSGRRGVRNTEEHAIVSQRVVSMMTLFTLQTLLACFLGPPPASVEVSPLTVV